MAKYRRGKKIEPAVMTMTFATPGTAGGSYTIDLSQSASLLNRRFYRQGINWVVESIKFLSSGSGTVQVAKIPTTWTFFNAYKKGFETWREMNAQALEMSQSVRARFEDFKIYADAIHHQAGYANNLLPLDSAGIAAAAGEWESSKIVVPNTSGATGAVVNFELLATGANYPGEGASGLDAVSLIEGYAASRGLPYQEDPNAPADASDVSGVTPENWMGAVGNEGTNQDFHVINDQITENNKAPYPFEGDGTATDTQYPGGANQLSNLEYHDVVQIFASSSGQIGARMGKGGIFPAGLMRINWTPEGSTNLVMQVNMVPGEHRGYMCEPTLEA